MTVVGVSLSGVAVGFFNYSAFGMDPFQVLAHGLWNLTPLGYGTFYTAFSFILLILVLITDRKKNRAWYSHQHVSFRLYYRIFLLAAFRAFSKWKFFLPAAYAPNRNFHYVYGSIPIFHC